MANLIAHVIQSQKQLIWNYKMRSNLLKCNYTVNSIITKGKMRNNRNKIQKLLPALDKITINFNYV